MFRDIDKTPSDIGPMVLIGSASFNMLVVTGVSILGATAIKPIQKLGVFAVTAFFSMFAYIWFFIVLCVVTPGYIHFWEAVCTLILYFVLVLGVYATEWLNTSKDHVDDIDE